MYMDSVRQVVRQFLFDNCLPEEREEALADDLDLQEHGVLDSLKTLQLVSFLEGRFSLEFLPEELETDRLTSVDAIERLVTDKLETR